MRARILAAITAVLLLLSGCLYETAGDAPSLSEGEAIFHFIDVGQGDCSLIQTKDCVILIDAGTAQSGSDIYNYLESLGIEYIDCFIATHPHEDHLGGTAAVMSGIDIGTIYLNDDSSGAYFYEQFIDTAIENNVEVKLTDMNCAYKYGPVTLRFLSPTQYIGDTNNDSIVTLLSFGNIKALFMADAEGVVEKSITDAYDIDADILKVGHHGSRNASTAAFLREVSPAVSVIQCGKDNSYGHPHKEAVARLEKTGAPILRTDKSGTIVLKTDGESIFDSEGKKFPVIAAPAQIKYIGNKKSQTLHTEDCPNLPGEGNRIYFKSYDEATASGYKACGNCIGK